MMILQEQKSARAFLPCQRTKFLLVQRHLIESVNAFCYDLGQFSKIVSITPNDRQGLTRMLPLLCEPSELLTIQEHTKSPDLLIIDLGTEERYQAEHIPGAIHISPAEIQAAPPIPGFIPSDTTLTPLARRIGLAKNRHVVVYDDEGGGWAGRFIWILDEIGHTRYSYLNGGLVAWKGDGYLCESGPCENGPRENNDATQSHSDIIVTANHQHSVTLDILSERLNDENTRIWDARSPMEYRGEKRFSARAGHIPNAINYEWTQAMDPARHLRLKTLDKLEAELSEIGLTKDHQIITHCQSHHRSGLTYLVGKILGFPDIKAYPGSWGEWGNRQDTPIDT